MPLMDTQTSVLLFHSVSYVHQDLALQKAIPFSTRVRAAGVAHLFATLYIACRSEHAPFQKKREKKKKKKKKTKKVTLLSKAEWMNIPFNLPPPPQPPARQNFLSTPPFFF